MAPILVTPPSAPLVALADLKAHLGVNFADDDALIQSLEKAAVAHLDGWRGILGRCIKQQVWAVSFGCAGCHRLPFPDVASVVVDAGDVVLSQDALGSRVEITEPTTVTMTIKAPDDVAEIAGLAVKMLVAHWYANREAVGVGGLQEMPFAVNRLLAPIRWILL